MKKVIVFLFIFLFLLSFISAVWWNPFTWFEKTEVQLAPPSSYSYVEPNIPYELATSPVIEIGCDGSLCTTRNDPCALDLTCASCSNDWTTRDKCFSKSPWDLKWNGQSNCAIKEISTCPGLACGLRCWEGGSGCDVNSNLACCGNATLGLVYKSDEYQCCNSNEKGGPSNKICRIDQKCCDTNLDGKIDGCCDSNVQTSYGEPVEQNPCDVYNFVFLTKDIIPPECVNFDYTIPWDQIPVVCQVWIMSNHVTQNGYYANLSKGVQSRECCSGSKPFCLSKSNDFYFMTISMPIDSFSSPPSACVECVEDSHCSSGKKCCGFSCLIPSAEICDDGLDNDCNGKIDCADSACANFPACIMECTPGEGKDSGDCRVCDSTGHWDNDATDSAWVKSPCKVCESMNKVDYSSQDIDINDCKKCDANGNEVPVLDTDTNPADCKKCDASGNWVNYPGYDKSLPIHDCKICDSSGNEVLNSDDNLFLALDCKKCVVASDGNIFSMQNPIPYNTNEHCGSCPNHCDTSLGKSCKPIDAAGNICGPGVTPVTYDCRSGAPVACDGNHDGYSCTTSSGTYGACCGTQCSTNTGATGCEECVSGTLVSKIRGSSCGSGSNAGNCCNGACIKNSDSGCSECVSNIVYLGSENRDVGKKQTKRANAACTFFDKPGICCAGSCISLDCADCDPTLGAPISLGSAWKVGKIKALSPPNIRGSCESGAGICCGAICRLNENLCNSGTPLTSCFDSSGNHPSGGCSFNPNDLKFYQCNQVTELASGLTFDDQCSECGVVSADPTLFDYMCNCHAPVNSIAYTCSDSSGTVYGHACDFSTPSSPRVKYKTCSEENPKMCTVEGDEVAPEGVCECIDNADCTDDPTNPLLCCDGTCVPNDITHCGSCNQKCDGAFGTCTQNSDNSYSCKCPTSTLSNPFTECTFGDTLLCGHNSRAFPCGSSCLNCGSDNCVNGACQSSSTALGSCSGGNCGGETPHSSYYLVREENSQITSIKAYQILPSGIYFKSMMNISLNYSIEEFPNEVILYRYEDSFFDNSPYSVLVINSTSKQIGSEGGKIEIGNVSFSIAEGDLNSSILFELKEVQIINQNFNEDRNTSEVISLIKNWIKNKPSVGISDIFKFLRSFFS